MSDCKPPKEDVLFVKSESYNFTIESDAIELHKKSKVAIASTGHYLGLYEVSEDGKEVVITNDPFLIFLGFDSATGEGAFLDLKEDPNAARTPKRKEPEILRVKGRDFSEFR